MSQLSPILEVEQESQDTSSAEIYTPPLLQPDTISPHSRVALDTQTHNAQPIDISPQQPITSAVTLAHSHVTSYTKTDSSQTNAHIQQVHLQTITIVYQPRRRPNIVQSLASLSDVGAVMKPRLEARWNLLGCPKLANRSQPLVDRSSPYREDMCRRYCCLTIF